MVVHRSDRTGRPARRARAHVLAESRTCIVCGHGDADSTDHIVPLARGGDTSVDNQGPCHHEPCPTCGRRCNREKGTHTLAELAEQRRTSVDWCGL